ncbi:hypothetical protein HDU76_002345 [Blyttiomyces sp. JEL0837]|nr:hypothetical protein HDU76_002345 [Blyttiomyces sp. JEL0837]
MSNTAVPQPPQFIIPPGKKIAFDDVQKIITAPKMPLELVQAQMVGPNAKDKLTVRVYKNTPPSMRLAIMASQVYGNDDYVVFNDERVTYRENFVRVANLANVFVKAGVKKGERIVSIGAIIVPINAWLKVHELFHIYTDSSSKILIVDNDRAKMLLEASQDEGGNGVKSSLLERVRKATNFEALKIVVVCRWKNAGGKTGGFDASKYFERNGGVEGVVDYEEFIGRGKGMDVLPNVEEILPDDDATILYTSGTTGKPKGALGTHRNYMTNLMNSAFSAARERLLKGEGLPMPAPPGPRDPKIPQEAVLVGVPLFHATATHALVGPGTVAGVKIVLMNKWDAKNALELIQRERITSAGGVPVFLWEILEHPDVKKYDLSSLNALFSGGAPAAKELVPQMSKKFPKVMPRNGYGLTETSAAACLIGGPEYQKRPDSVGRPVPTLDVRIVEPGNFDKVLPVNAVGEIAVRGPTVVKGYYNNPTATAKSFSPDGWFLTGDVGRIDKEGYVYIMDRAKDMLIRGGENIYCVEVEDCLFAHPSVIDCAVVGLPHRILGEEVAAAVQIKSEHLKKITPEQLIRHCKSKLAHFKVPIYIEIRNESLPRNAAGKILKNVVREEVVASWKRKTGSKL